MFSWLFGKKRGLPSDYQKYLDPDAVAIVKQLEEAGFETYLVGGCVRDVLLRRKPKDFDIATQATPQQVKAIVKRSFIIGKRFRIVVAKRRWRSHEMAPPEHGLFPFHFDSATEKEFQITTFRRDPVVVNGVINENVFGSPEEDAKRRDFTINGLFLEPVNGSIVDFVGGLKDLNQKTLRMIGDPVERFREDPIRILRALRFQARAGLKLDRATAHAMQAAVPLLAEAKKERIREEILKAFREGSAAGVFREFQRLGAWQHVSPELGYHFTQTPEAHDKLLRIAAQTDATRWTHPRNASPLFLLLLQDFLQHGHAGQHLHAKYNAISDDLKISRAEREEITRIRHTLSRIFKDPEAKHSTRFIGHDSRHHINLAGAFYVLKIMADSEVEPYSNCWNQWKTPWTKQVCLTPSSHQGHMSHHHHQAHHGQAGHSGRQGAASGSKRRSSSRRRRRPGSASGAGAGTGSASSGVTATSAAAASSSSGAGGGASGGSSSSD